METALRRRIATAIVLLVPVVAIMLIGGRPLVLLSLAAFGIINYELFSFATPYDFRRKLQLCLCTALMPLGYLAYGAGGMIGGLILGALMIFALTVIWVEKDVHELNYARVVPASLLGLGYTGVLGASLVVVASAVSGERILWILLAVIGADTLAYFGGRAIGGAKLAPRISPNKTISGACCGLGGAILGSLLGAWVFGLEMHWLAAGATGLLIGVLAIFGDLAESLVKRSYEVKDSGNILPGHGGLLDRIDALLFAAPILFLV